MVCNFGVQVRLFLLLPDRNRVRDLSGHHWILLRWRNLFRNIFSYWLLLVDYLSNVQSWHLHFLWSGFICLLHLNLRFSQFLVLVFVVSSFPLFIAFI